MKYLIVGLGNIGRAYDGTRHNIGFMVVDFLASQYKVPFSSRYLAGMANIQYKGHVVYFVKPTTYMNLSGTAVHYWLAKFSIPIQHCLVIVDDIHLPLGKLRLRAQGGDGGHNGLKSIANSLATEHYARLRFGIGAHFLPPQQSSYVLGKFTVQEKTLLLPAIEQAATMALSFCRQGLTATMNQYN